MLRRVPLLALLVTAGCFASPVAQPAEGPTSAGAPSGGPWRIDSCAFVIAAVKVRAADLAPHLPSGFAAITQAGVAEIHFDAYRCGEVSWLGAAPIADAGYGSVYVPVVAPTALREPGYGNYFVKYDTLVTDADAQSALEDAGLPARAGDATVELTALAGGAFAIDASLDMGAVGFRVTGSGAAGQAQDGALPFVEYTPLAQGGLARWHARLHDANIAPGAGVIEIRGWPAVALGVDRAPATLIAGTWNLDQADVSYPIPWP